MSLEGKTEQEIAALAELSAQLSSNPKTRAGFLQLSKMANPDAAIPEVDIPVQVKAMMAEGLKRVEAAEKKVSDMELERSITARRENLLSDNKFGITKKDLPEIERLMLEKHIPDHETAAEFYAMQRKAAEPTPSNARQSVREQTMPTVDLKPFKGSINDWARNAAKNALDEIRGQGQIKIN